MKRLVKSALTLVIALVTVLVLVACGPTEETEGDTLVVGSPEINGDFISGFGDSAYDNWVRSLIFGYSTYATTPLGEIVLNETVVDSLETDVDVDGNKTYTFVIHDDLLWSDDTPMTAKDFVFGIMFSASKDWVASGAESTSGEALVGYSAYRVGETTSADVVFEGVKLINDYEFSVTIDAVELPYFYETLYAAFGPMPMHHLAPSNTVLTSDANGTTMTAAGYSQMGDVVSPGGYRYAPIVSSGPYKFVSFVNQVVTLVKDDNFKGNYLGLTPTIQNIIIRRVNSAIDVELVINGELDLVTGVIEGEKIEASAASPNTNQTYYSRNGYGLLAMQAHFGPTMNYKVRQAIAHLTDREYTNQIVLGGYGSIVFSEYGLAQWMYVQSEEWVNENLNKYEFSITQANDILDTTEWVFEDDGITAFNRALAVADSDYFRHNADGDVLKINHLGSEGITVTSSLAAKFYDNMQLAGIEYTNAEGPFSFLLDHYYYAYDLEPEEKLYHIFNLATNFGSAYDPYYSWHSDWLGTWRNGHQLEDSVLSPTIPLEAGEKTLDELIELMRETTPGDNATYLAYWRQYQLRWNKLIPNVPLYSNQYYDIFDADLKGVTTTPFWDWTDAINEMYFD